MQLGQDRNQSVRDVAQYFGKMIDPKFVPDDNRFNTNKSHVRRDERSAEQRPNPHGAHPTYTVNGTYHRFEHPRKQDGTIDERYTANRDRNQNGDPDMRIPHNRTQRAQREHLNEDGSENMRSMEHRESLVDDSGHRLNTDGTPDMRCAENQPKTSVADHGNENAAAVPVKADGTADMRYKASQEAAAAGLVGPDVPLKAQNDSNAKPASLETVESTVGNTDAIPTKADGTADMRYNVSKDAVAAGQIDTTDTDGSPGKCSRKEDAWDMRCRFLEAHAQSEIPTKADGTADMRFNASQDAVDSGEISCDQVLGGAAETESSVGGQ